MREFFRGMKRKLIRAKQDPELVVPYIKDRIDKHFSDKAVYELLEKHGGVRVASGTEKEVFRVPFHFQDGSMVEYAIAFVRASSRDKFDASIAIERMRGSREWHRKVFSDTYLNKESLFPSKNPHIIIYVQPWVEFDETKRDLFYHIPNNIEAILREMKENREFCEQLQDISRRTLEEYMDTGLLPDFYNHFGSVKGEKNPANILLTKENQLLFIDTHSVFHDTRIPFRKEKEMRINEVRDESRLSYTDELIQALKRIVSA